MYKNFRKNVHFLSDSGKSLIHTKKSENLKKKVIRSTKVI